MSLTLQQEQKLLTRLSPAQIQMVKMLELPSVELQQRIDEELQENPALEEGEWDNQEDGYKEAEENEGEEEFRNPLQNEDFNYDDYVNDDEMPVYSGASGYDSSEDRQESVVISGSTLFDHLKSQVYLTSLTKPERHIAKWVLGNIDDDGYLRRTTEQLVDDLAFQENITISDEAMQRIVNIIKQFDPSGIAAYDLRECLMNQLKQKPASEAIDNAIQILERYFDDFGKRHFDKIKERLNLSEDDLKDAIDEVLHLNQKPANGFVGSVYENQKSTIIPDFMVENREGELIVNLNTGDIPELHVSKDYQSMLNEYSRKGNQPQVKETVRFIKQRIEAAQGFIDAIEQRNETLTRTMEAIVKRQQEFFYEGDESFLKPMILQDIADITGYDVSTISRVSNSKYVQTQFGIYPLKYFFSESITNDAGEEISTREIKRILTELIDGEDKTRPLTDDELVEKLQEKNYTIARRTVAKYRDQLGYPVARLRKSL